jgi:hypothetical protein
MQSQETLGHTFILRVGFELKIFVQAGQDLSPRYWIPLCINARILTRTKDPSVPVTYNLPSKCGLPNRHESEINDNSTTSDYLWT